MGRLLHLVQRGGAGRGRSPPRPLLTGLWPRSVPSLLYQLKQTTRQWPVYQLQIIQCGSTLYSKWLIMSSNRSEFECVLSAGFLCLLLPNSKKFSTSLDMFPLSLLRCLQKEMATYSHWSVSLWRDPNDVSHCRILSPDKTEWRLISATLCGWGCCFVADQLWLMTRIREEEDCSELNVTYKRFTNRLKYLPVCSFGDTFAPFLYPIIVYLDFLNVKMCAVSWPLKKLNLINLVNLLTRNC